jgi:hypothetical protein
MIDDFVEEIDSNSIPFAPPRRTASCPLDARMRIAFKYRVKSVAECATLQTPQAGKATTTKTTAPQRRNESSRGKVVHSAR